MPQRVLGIELGTQSLALVQLIGTAKSYEVVAAVRQPWPQHANSDEQRQLRRQILHELIDTQQLRGDAVLVTLPAFHAALRNLILPFKDTRRIRQVLKYTLDEYIPFEPDEIVADFQLLPTDDANVTSILAAAVQQDLVAQTLELLQGVGLEPTSIDLDVFGLANAAILGSQSRLAKTILIDVQPARTLLVLIHRNTPVFTRSWAHGWPQPAVTIEAYASRLSKHLQHTMYAYENIAGQSYEADGFLLSGASGDDLESLATALRQEFGTAAEVWCITAGAYKDGSAHFPPANHPQFAVAFGTALRGLHRQAVGINLRRERFKLHRDIEELRGRLMVLGCLLIFLAGLGVGSLYLDDRYKTQRYAQLQEEIARTFRTTLPQTRMVQPVFQLQEKVREIRDRMQAFGGLSGGRLSGLQALREISARIPASLTLNVDTLTITTGTVNMSGTTESYGDVEKLKEALEASPAIAVVKINTTKADAANKVAFKLTITAEKNRENAS